MNNRERPGEAVNPKKLSLFEKVMGKHKARTLLGSIFQT
jgi:hypothetical protein